MFHDLETGRQLYIDPQAARAEYRRRFAAHAAELKRICIDLGIDFAELTTDRPLELALFDLLQARLRRGRRHVRACSKKAEGRGMSVLTPLYVLGLLAVSLPVIFHLIRRMPRGRFPFSSLMFLSPSPPRLTRRSRLENILLLILRGAVLSLLAFAFARPFLRQQMPLESGNAERSRVAVIVDTSASMRRGDLWQQAIARVDEVMAEGRPFDQVAVFTCDATLRPLIGFEDMSQVEPAQRRGLVAARLQSVSPTWAATHLGQGLMDAVEIVNNDSGVANERGRVARRVVLISDMQQGSRFNALADYPWPEEVRLELRRVAARQKSNAGLHWLAERSPTQSLANAEELRVRISNDADSVANEFELEWLDATGRAIGTPVTAHVPAGESRIVRVRRPNETASRLRLSGDNCDFDNTLYFANRAEAAQSVIYLGSDEPDDPRGASILPGARPHRRAVTRGAPRINPRCKRPAPSARRPKRRWLLSPPNRPSSKLAS